MKEHDLWAEISGQSEAVSFLKKTVLSPLHAYLFVGPEGAGREELSRAFAGSVFASSEEEERGRRSRRLAWRGIHPDLVIIDPEGRGLRVVDAQRVISEASRSPVESKKKVIVVNRFDSAEPEAVVSLLKTIEEPPSTSIFVLLASDIPESHITVSSRCIKVDVPAITIQKLSEILENEGVKPDESNLLAEAANGNLGRARLLLEDPSFFQRYATWKSIPERLDGSGSAVAIAVNDLQKMIDDAQLTLVKRHDKELEEILKQEETFGTRGSGRQSLVDRHRREIRRLRDDELRLGLATLIRRYRDSVIVEGNTDDLNAVGVITCSTGELIRNPNERLFLQALLLNLSRVHQ